MKHVLNQSSLESNSLSKNNLDEDNIDPKTDITDLLPATKADWTIRVSMVIKDTFQKKRNCGNEIRLQTVCGETGNKIVVRIARRKH